MKRDDLLHPSVSGNKFRKLKHNLFEMQRLGLRQLVTFGGAFSNHIHATAAAGAIFGIETFGIIRGEPTTPLSKTLEFAAACSMNLHFVSRANYRDKTLIVNQLKERIGEFYLLPEGGTNTFALRGAAEIVAEVREQLGAAPDYFCVPCGTGGTAAGIISATDAAVERVIGFSVLKGNFLQKDVTTLLNEMPVDHKSIHKNWTINTDFHFGGYAKWNKSLIHFINNFKQKHNVAFDPIYTGKMMFGIFDLVENGFFKENTTIIAVHTGGLQGIAGFNQRFGQLIDV